LATRIPSPIGSFYKIILFAIFVLIGYFSFDIANALASESPTYNDTVNALASESPTYNDTVNTLLLQGNASAILNFSNRHPTIYDPNLKVETVFKGLKFPTSMAFLGPNDILVLEKNEGKVQRIINGNMLSEPLLDVNVDNRGERGMLGIAVSKGEPKHPYVFLYYSEILEEYKNYCHSFSVNAPCVQGSKFDPLGNRVYRYELVNNNNKLVNARLLLDLPIKPGLGKIGGVTVIGPDNNVYVTIGDLLGYKNDTSKTKAQNFQNGTNPDGRAGILRVTQDGELVNGKSIVGDMGALKFYYAYGIRNSFGIDFDPVTGNLWDTENGPGYGDEINLVKPGFNSGWTQLQGMWKPRYDEALGGDFIAGEELKPGKDDLVNFNGSGKYSDPEFVWNKTVAVTSLKFLDSDKMGKEYENDMFVGDFNFGNLYHFDLNNGRTELSLEEPLNDKIANNNSELKKTILGKGFGGILDLEVGPDGYLYVLSIEKGRGGDMCRPDRPSSTCVSYSSPAEGTIFRILPTADFTKAKGKNGQ
jgi:glucose/arabinose dehydrogenase